MHENLNHTAKKHWAKKIKTDSYFQTITTNNRKYVSDFISNSTDTFMELLPNITTHFSRHFFFFSITNEIHKNVK